MKKCSRVITEDVDEEDTECNDAKNQYQSVVKQRDAYDSASTGLWIKFISLIVLEVATLAAVVVEAVAWGSGNAWDKVTTSVVASDVKLCISQASARPECAANADCIAAISKFEGDVEIFQTLYNTEVTGVTPASTASFCAKAAAWFAIDFKQLKLSCGKSMAAGCCGAISLEKAFEKSVQTGCQNYSGAKPCDLGCHVSGTLAVDSTAPKNEHYVNKNTQSKGIIGIFTELFQAVSESLLIKSAKADNCAEGTEDGDKVSCSNKGRYDSSDIGSLVTSVSGIIGSGVLVLMAKHDKFSDSFYQFPKGRTIGRGITAGIVGYLIADTSVAIDQVNAKIDTLNKVITTLENLTPQQINLEISQSELISTDLGDLLRDSNDFPNEGIPYGGGEKIPCVLRGQLGDGVSGCISSKPFNQKAISDLKIPGMNEVGTDLSDLGDSQRKKWFIERELAKDGKNSIERKKTKSLLNALKKKAFENLEKVGGPSEEVFNGQVKGLRAKLQENAVAALKAKGVSLDQFNEAMEKKNGLRERSK